MHKMGKTLSNQPQEQGDLEAMEEGVVGRTLERSTMDEQGPAHYRSGGAGLVEGKFFSVSSCTAELRTRLSMHHMMEYSITFPPMDLISPAPSGGCRGATQAYSSLHWCFHLTEKTCSVSC